MLARLLALISAFALAVAGAWCGSLPSAHALTERTRPHWSWPLSPAIQTRPYVAPQTAYGSAHRGLDLVAKPGTVLRMPFDGRVIFVGRVVDRTVLTVSNSPDWLLSFEAIASTVHIGDRVSRGAAIARVANGPHCACIHIGVRWRGMYVNPLLVFDSLPRSVLLPW